MRPTRLKIASIARRQKMLVNGETGWWFMQMQSMINAGLSDHAIREMQGCVPFLTAARLVDQLGLTAMAVHSKTPKEALQDALKHAAHNILTEYRADEIRAALVLEQQHDEED